MLGNETEKQGYEQQGQGIAKLRGERKRSCIAPQGTGIEFMEGADILARKPVRNGREKEEWEKRFYSTVKTEMDVFNLDNNELGKVLGICEDTFSFKLNDPCKFDIFEFCKMCDFLHIDRAELINKVCPKGFKR